MSDFPELQSIERAMSGAKGLTDTEQRLAHIVQDEARRQSKASLRLSAQLRFAMRAVFLSGVGLWASCFIADGEHRVYTASLLFLVLGSCLRFSFRLIDKRSQAE